MHQTEERDERGEGERNHDIIDKDTDIFMKRVSHNNNTIFNNRSEFLAELYPQIRCTESSIRLCFR